MARIAQSPAIAGSQRWLQYFVTHDPDALDPGFGSPVSWLSPRVEDDFAEYRDGAFLEKVGLDALAPALAQFWPKRGPVWDGLAREGNSVVLVEAKSHVPEFLSSPSVARAPASVARIAAALEEAKCALGAEDRSDWARCFFQYANRLAHLWWLTAQGVDAHLLFVSFLGDTRQCGPSHQETWTAAYRAADYALGLPARHRLSPHVHHVFPDVSGLG